MPPKPLQDYFNECYDGEARKALPADEFKKFYCDDCGNQGCVNSKGSQSKWAHRMRTQEEYLLRSPKFADLEDPSLQHIRQMDFRNLLRDVLAIEISTKKGDWSIPTEAEIGRAAAEVTGIVRPAVPSRFTIPEATVEPTVPETPPPEAKTGQKWKVRGESGIYEVTHSSDGKWGCTCPSRQVPCKHVQDIARRIKTAPAVKATEEVVEEIEAAAPVPGPPTHPAPVLKAQNTAVPDQGILVGGPDTRAPTTPEDPWALPKTSGDRVIPIGGRVTFGKR